MKNYKEFVNKQSKNFDIIKKDNKFILIFNGLKNTYELAEANIDSDITNYNNWNPTNMNIHAGYAWSGWEMRPYRKYIKHGFLKGTKGGEFSVDFVSINDKHFITGDKNCNNNIDHIIVMKRSLYKYDEELERHTIFKIENKNILKIDFDEFNIELDSIKYNI